MNTVLHRVKAVGLMALVALLACAPENAGAARLTGSITYRERIALPTGAEIRIDLENVTLVDAPPPLLASITLVTKGEQVPIPFELRYDPNAIRPGARYALTVRVTVNRKLEWISTGTVYVITQGQPTQNLEVVLNRYQQ